jgi:putative ABC transport system permease protein
MLAVRLYRLLLLAYPASLRASHGDEMTLVVAERWRERPGIVARMSLIRDIVTDFVQSLPRAWRLERGQPSSDRSPRGGGGRGLGTDFRQAVRGLTQAPLFTLGATFTLAIGIGASTAIFSLARATLLHPLDIRDPDRVVELGTTFSHPVLRGLESRSQSFSGLASWTNLSIGLDRGGQTINLTGVAINGRYFDTLGLRPGAGRLLEDSDDQVGAPPVAVLGDDAWKRLFGADPAIVGSTIRLGRGVPTTIVGVAPAGFRGLTLSNTAQIFIPVRALGRVATGFFATPETLERTNITWITVAARLRDGVTLTQAADETNALRRAIDPPKSGDAPEPTTLTPITASALSLTTVDDLRRFLMVLAGATIVTLLLACATVANLLLLRAERRQRELAIRAALGAGRARTMRLLFAESVLLGLCGGLGGVAAASGALALLGRFQLPGRIAIGELHLAIDVRVLAMAVGLGVLTSVIFGAAPIWQSMRLDLIGALREGSRGSSRQPLRSTLVTLQVALAVLLLAGSLAFARAVRHGVGVDLGFDTTSTAIVTIDATLGGYKQERVGELQNRVLDWLAARPEVAGAGWSAMPPLSGVLSWGVDIEGQPVPKDHLSIEANIVSPGYFRAMNIQLLGGRVFTRDDLPGGETFAIVSEAAARKYWPGASALGGRVDLNAGDSPARWAQVIGVVGDVSRSVGGHAEPMLYLLDVQIPQMFDFGGQHLIVRDVSGADLAAREGATAIATADSHLPITSVMTMADRLRGTLEPQRLGLMLFSLFAGLAIVLTAFGLYALVAYAVAHRTREIGIRIALGASGWTVVALVVRQGLVPVLIGLAAGSIAFRLSGWAIQRFLFALPLFGGWAFIALTLAIAAVAVVAMLAPARRALAVDPVAALRTD